MDSVWKNDAGSELVVRPARRTVVFALVAYAAILALTFHGLGVQGIFRDSFIIWRTIVFGGALFLGYVYLSYRMTSLRITRGELTKKSGILVRNLSRVGIDKVTDYRYHRPLISLLLGFVDLQIETASSSEFGPEINMRFLCMRDAKAVMTRMREERDALEKRKAGGLAANG